MHLAHRYISSLLLAAVLAAPVTIMAAPAPQRVAVQLRVYDRNHKDYHDWNDREESAYRRYLEERHQSYRVYNRQHHRAQNHYWDWRHRHPDHD